MTGIWMFLSASYLDNKIAWFPNDGNGFFEYQRVITTNAKGASSVYAADLDNDGDMDVLSASTLDHKIAWYENLDDGTFGEEQIISNSVKSVTSVQAVDLDNDGIEDVLGTSSEEGQIIWYKNYGNSFFGAGKQVTVGNNDVVLNLRVADLDNDGYKDLVAFHTQIVWYKNYGSGNFGLPKDITPETFKPGAFTLANINFDSNIDILVTNYNDKKIYLLKNDGDGTFDKYVKLVSFQTAINHIFARDIDGDGDKDFVTISSPDENIYVYKKTAPDFFMLTQTIPTYNKNVKNIYLLEIDKDEYSDLLSVSYDDDVILWYQNDSMGSFIEEQKIISESINDLRDTYIADLNNDFYYDIINLISKNKISWLRNENGKGFSPELNISIGDIDINYLVTVDLDNDNDIDILFSQDGLKGNIHWLKNDGNGSFDMQQFPIAKSENELCKILVVDLDDDGNKDIVADMCFEDDLIWFKNDGNYNFSEQQKKLSQNTEIFFAVDLNGDNKLDILLNDGYQIEYNKNLGEGNMSLPSIIDFFSNLKAFCPIDINQDGYLDILVSYGLTIAWLENNGTGKFDKEHYIGTTGSGVLLIQAHDLDNDGDEDFLVTYNTSLEKKVQWFENKGNGNFSQEQNIVLSNDKPRDLLIKDIDRDNDLDVLVSFKIINGEHKIAQYKNLLIDLPTNTSTKPAMLQSPLYTFTLQPNPANQNIQIVLHDHNTSVIKKPIPYTLYNIYGQILQKGILYHANQTLNIADLPKGLYYLKLEEGEGRRFVKM